jgi:hypothetical protein
VGTGAEAARAAGAAADVVAEASSGNLVALVGACHEALSGTRGVAMSAAYFAAGEQTMTWLGVGNVEGGSYREAPRGLRRPSRCRSSRASSGMTCRR